MLSRHLSESLRREASAPYRVLFFFMFLSLVMDYSAIFARIYSEDAEYWDTVLPYWKCTLEEHILSCFYGCMENRTSIDDVVPFLSQSEAVELFARLREKYPVTV